MSEHTPGPWVYDDDTATIDNDLGVSVAGINVDLHNYEANARLIAAAPDLLAAAKNLVDCYTNPDRNLEDTAWAALDAAIERAEEPQP